MQVNGATEIYGIMGQPVSHSLSPAMHNAVFQQLGLNKIYVPFAVDQVAMALDGFRALGVRGVSVTIPHKQAAIPFLDFIDPVAEKIGAVNTLVLAGEKIRGYNTDWLGANMALAGVMVNKSASKKFLTGKQVLILGAGGSARAVGFGIIEAGGIPILASRTPARGQELSRDLACEWVPLSEVQGVQADALVNATSVGMTPKVDQTPLPQAVLKNFPVVMDIVYSPRETRLLREAKAAGCLAINGEAMLLFQAVHQFELWVPDCGKELSEIAEIMRQALPDQPLK